MNRELYTVHCCCSKYWRSSLDLNDKRKTLIDNKTRETIGLLSIKVTPTSVPYEHMHVVGLTEPFESTRDVTRSYSERRNVSK